MEYGDRASTIMYYDITIVNTSADYKEDRGTVAAFRAYLAFYNAFPVPLYTGVLTGVSVIGSLANLTLFLSLIRASRYKSPTFVIIISLAITDFCSCLNLGLYSNLILPVVNIPGTGYLCSIFWYIGTVVALATTYHLSAFSVMRFFQLTRPLTAKVMFTSTFVARSCCAIWLACAIASLPIGILYSHVTQVIDGYPITICQYSPSTNLKAKDLAINSAIVIVPSVIITLSHTTKHIAVLRSNKAGEINGGTSGKSTSTLALLIVLSVFLMCYMPATIHIFAHQLFHEPRLPYHNLLFLMQVTLYIVSSFVNPWIYAIATKSVRSDIREFLAFLLRCP